VKQQDRFVSLRWKLLIGFTVVFSIVFFAAFYWFLTYSLKTLENQIAEDLKSTHAGASLGIPGDLVVELAEEGEADADGSSDHPNFTVLMNWFEIVHDIEPRAWPYLGYVINEDEIMYVADIQLLPQYDSSRAGKFGELQPSANIARAKQEQFLRGADEGKLTYTDEWGSWVSAYGPIYDSQGEVVALLGVDFEADVVTDMRAELTSRVLLAGFVAYLILLVLVYLVSNALTGPIIRLTGMADEIGEGKYEHDFSQVSKGTLRDEIDKLADVIEVMVGKVYERELKLKKQVQKLQIEIDETRRKMQVKEIVETDFFKNLQSKAKDMRDRRKGK
jgi:methyl-accepting chemotaxis protein